MTQNGLIIVCVPSLVSVLARHEQEKGAPLTENEVLDIRNGAAAIALPADVAEGLDIKRGYKDIGFENCWEEWKQIRLTLHTSSVPN